MSEIEFIFQKYYNYRQPIAIYLPNINGIIVVLEENEKITDLDHQSLLKYIPSYGIPRKIHIVKQFPYLVSGKIDREELVRLFSNEEYLNRDQIDFDEKLINILSEFGINEDNLNKNLIDIGGSSLFIISLLNRLHQYGFYQITLHQLINAKQMKDIFTNQILPSDHQLNLFENYNDQYKLIPLKYVDQNKAIGIISESFVEFSPIEKLIHQNDEEIKKELKQEWINILNQLWNYFIQSNLSFSIQFNGDNEDIFGIALSNDLLDKISMDITHIKHLTPVFDLIENGENQLVEQLRQLSQLPKRILSNFLTTASPSSSPQDKIKLMYFLEKQIMETAKLNEYEGVLTCNVSPLIVQFAQDIFKYDHSLLIHLNKYQYSPGKFLFPHAEDDQSITAFFKFIR